MNPIPKLSPEERELRRPHVAEWFGHRVFPTVADHPAAQLDQREQRCPFLSEVADRDMSCVKSANSRGVCTISASSNGTRQDWLVCPHRALDDELLHSMVRRLFDVGATAPIHVRPVTNLADLLIQTEVVSGLRAAPATRQFVTFQQLFGGEISLPRSKESPELSFDVTVAEVVEDETGGLKFERYGVIEIQTTDTHGTYKNAVDALVSALDLQRTDFGAQMLAHPEWAGRGIEGPNISNVFKRTFYQVMFKFQLSRRSWSAGCVLALPRPVWDSWLPFLGAPEVVDMGDGTHRLRAPGETDISPVGDVRSWIYVFDVDEVPPADGSTSTIDLHFVIATDAPTLSRLALEVAPTNAIGDVDAEDSVLTAMRRRVKNFAPVT